MHDAADSFHDSGQTIVEDRLAGKLTIRQFARGYRFSMDAVLLGGYVQPACGERWVDLGTGCGVLALILAWRHPRIRLLGVEIQPALARLARSNVSANRLDARIEVHCRDFRDLTTTHTNGWVDGVISNPPYMEAGGGRLNPEPQRAAARHEIHAGIDDVTAAAARVLRPGGRLAVVYPARRLTDLLTGMRRAGIEPRHLLTVQGRIAGPVKRVLVSGIRGAGAGMQVAPPLVIFDSTGNYTPAAAKLLDL